MNRVLGPPSMEEDSVFIWTWFKLQAAAQELLEKAQMEYAQEKPMASVPYGSPNAVPETQTSKLVRDLDALLAELCFVCF